jgi:hypothetical protein
MSGLGQREMEMLTAMLHAGPNATVANIKDCLPAEDTRSGVSSRLCKMRDKLLCVSTMEHGVNLWTLTDVGQRAAQMLQPGPAPSEPAPEPEPAIDWYQSVTAEMSRLQRRGLERSNEAIWLVRALGDFHGDDAPLIKTELHRIADYLEAVV